MSLEVLLQEFQRFETKMAYFRFVDRIIGWDASTTAPRNSVAFRSRMLGEMNRESFEYQMDPKHLSMLERLSEEKDVPESVRRSAKKYLVSINKIRKLPKELYVAQAENLEQSSRVWEEARRTSNYALFAPYLEKVIYYTLKSLEYRNEEKESYDVLLNDYEEGMDMVQYDHFFDTVKKTVVPLVADLQAQGESIDDSVLYQYYPREQQEKLVNYLMDTFHFDRNSGIYGISVHPFTNGITPDDTRFTVRFLDHYLPASLFATIHELGHSLHNQHNDPKLTGTILYGSSSCGIAESQSRFLENYIGRSHAFWAVHFNKLQELFPEQMKGLASDSFYRIVNRVKPSLIRIEADELTYPLHILLRYEMERDIISEKITVDKLPDIWNDKYEAYLGVRPKNDAEGILQDMHWSSDSGFGYFPTYALGTAYGAQFYHSMNQDFDVEQALLQNDIPKINHWLKAKIHQYGSFYKPEEILLSVCQETFNPSYYTDYLVKKYRAIYHL